jgi:hypothetical protein
MYRIGIELIIGAYVLILHHGNNLFNASHANSLCKGGIGKII